MTGIDGYYQIRNDVLSLFWLGCRDEGAGLRSGRPEDLVVWTINEFDGAYDHPFELLMFCVVGLGLCGTWNKVASSHLRSTALHLIEGYSEGVPLVLLSEEEAIELVGDLRALGLI